MFEQLKLTGWRQFKEVDIKFHKRLTIITGTNGAGKTSILNILNNHFGWNINFIASITKDKETGLIKYLSGLFTSVFGKPSADNSGRQIGSLLYTDGVICRLMLPPVTGQQYSPSYEGKKSLEGVFIPSHRPVVRYQAVSQLPTQVIESKSAIDSYTNDYRNQYMGGGGNSPSYRIKEALLSLAIFGGGGKYVQANERAQNIYDGFQEKLKKILPREIGFVEFRIENPEINLVTKSGNFSVDAVSGGLASIIDMSWQIYLRSLDWKNFIVTMDEPENHLHPEMQRRILGSLISAFPNVQFIVATHSPFIVGSVEDSSVFVLRPDESLEEFSDERKEVEQFIPTRIVSQFLDRANKTGTANQILRDVLGVSVTNPLWVERRISEISSKYSSLALSSETMSELKNDLAVIGLDDCLPEALAQILRQRTS